MQSFVVIAGNIGVGKSTLTARLAERFGWQPFYEAVEENPYLADFYASMRDWSFHSQVYFLSRRINQLAGLQQFPGAAIQDRSIYEDAEIFARNLYLQGEMSDRDWQTYFGLYQTTAALLRPPDLVVYLQASAPVLLRHIAQRGREYERSIDPAYLARLNLLYDEWAARFAVCPLLTVSVDAMDFVRHPAHFDSIAALIAAQL